MLVVVVKVVVDVRVLVVVEEVTLVVVTVVDVVVEEVTLVVDVVIVVTVVAVVVVVVVVEYSKQRNCLPNPADGRKSDVHIPSSPDWLKCTSGQMFEEPTDKSMPALYPSCMHSALTSSWVSIALAMPAGFEALAQPCS